MEWGCAGQAFAAFGIVQADSRKDWAQMLRAVGEGGVIYQVDWGLLQQRAAVFQGPIPAGSEHLLRADGAGTSVRMYYGRRVRLCCVLLRGRAYEARRS